MLAALYTISLGSSGMLQWPTLAVASLGLVQVLSGQARVVVVFVGATCPVSCSLVRLVFKGYLYSFSSTKCMSYYQ